MAELTVPPLLAHAPEALPPWRWRLVVLPACVAIIGILIATACCISGQDTRRDFATLELKNDYAHAEAALSQAELRHEPPDQIEKLQEELDRQRARKISSYAQYGRHFTQWDGYRYEEIATHGYVYHQPTDPQAIQDSSTMLLPGETEPRLKNVSWYPLYPMIGMAVSQLLHISVNAALTGVSQACAILTGIVFFMYARRHYFNRMPRLGAVSETEPVPALVNTAAEQHPTRRWDLSPEDTAALWACAALFYGPCSIFLYANYTESLFLLLLVCFLYCLQSRWWWRAALVAAVASSCRAQGVLFGPVLALTVLLRSDIRKPVPKFGLAFVLGVVSSIGLLCYMIYLNQQFHDPLAFSHAQRYWNVGIHRAQVYNALNPVNALTHCLNYVWYTQPMDWPRLWESLCVIWPPIMLLILGGRFLSFELEVVGWLLWGLPYFSSGLAGYPPMNSQWMSMGRFVLVLLPAHVIFGAVFARFRWAGIPWLAVWASAFAVFAYKFGAGNWIG